MIRKTFKNIEEFNEDQCLPKPENPLFSIGNVKSGPDEIRQKHPTQKEISYTNEFYVISLKKIVSGEIIYGRTKYDCTTGTMLFWAPNQTLITRDIAIASDIWYINFHDDFIRGLDIRKRIKNYNFFNYNVNEALHLSPTEEETVKSIFRNIEKEYHNNQDEFSKDIIVSHLETLLKYADRFYKRQFLNRKELNKDLMTRFYDALNAYFENDQQIDNGIPSLAYMADQLGISQRYLSDSIKAESGKTAIDQINLYLVEEAKNLLLQPNASITETAYKLGFEYPQYFTRLFKKKTGVSPKGYIESANVN
ncbi:helix-turn-helix domain-containing protein [Carboxylicivirga sp. RSCT41]|uniref:helix-turn-helix domain-containing protein n=1 Tax=Carboxylicivirga agarovorans TaxID=3417570 RepID=UPI003D33FE71